MKAWLAGYASLVALSVHAAAYAGPAPGPKVQVGAFASPEIADTEVAKIRNLFPGGTGSEVSSTVRDGKTFYRSLVTGFASRDEATAYCDRIKAAGRDCLVRAAGGAGRPVQTAAQAAVQASAPAPVLQPATVMAAAPPEQLDFICSSEVIQSAGAPPREVPAASRAQIRFSLDLGRRLMCDHRMCGRRANDVIQSADERVIKALQRGGATFTVDRTDGRFTWSSPTGARAEGRCEAAPFTDRIPKAQS